MKNYLIIILSLFFLNSCTKKTAQYIYRGSVFNSIDSEAYANTPFKVYREHSNLKNGKNEKYFTTDANGYFEITTDFSGEVCWPSYCNCATYNGPEIFTQTKYENIDSKEILTHIVTYDSVYTKPWH
jgi:hypothetical protein